MNNNANANANEGAGNQIPQEFLQLVPRPWDVTFRLPERQLCFGSQGSTEFLSWRWRRWSVSWDFKMCISAARWTYGYTKRDRDSKRDGDSRRDGDSKRDRDFKRDRALSTSPLLGLPIHGVTSHKLANSQDSSVSVNDTQEWDGEMIVKFDDQRYLERI
ncbi:hypothetical protein BDR06DRAFT_970377 [Suillus hirtellus]|nr:hypothetical protein BDR06DRAFT_970377 [Suillus hirtellus]